MEEQFKAFKEGFNELIPQELINVFDERELELLMGGIAEIDVDDWKKHTDYRGYSEHDEVVQWFWQVSKLMQMIGIYEVLTLTLPTVRTLLGRRKEISSASVHHWHLSYSC